MTVSADHRRRVLDHLGAHDLRVRHDVSPPLGGPEAPPVPLSPERAAHLSVVTPASAGLPEPAEGGPRALPRSARQIARGPHPRPGRTPWRAVHAGNGSAAILDAHGAVLFVTGYPALADQVVAIVNQKLASEIAAAASPPITSSPP